MSNCSNLVLAALEELESATAADIAAQAEVSPTTAHKWLRSFVAEGRARLIRNRYGMEHYEIVTPEPVVSCECWSCTRPRSKDCTSEPPAPATPVTAQEVLDHRPHPIAAAPHLLVCTCGETFSAVEAQSTAGEQWAVHVANELSQRVRR